MLSILGMLDERHYITITPTRSLTDVPPEVLRQIPRTCRQWTLLCLISKRMSHLLGDYHTYYGYVFLLYDRILQAPSSHKSQTIYSQPRPITLPTYIRSMTGSREDKMSPAYVPKITVSRDGQCALFKIYSGWPLAVTLNGSEYLCDLYDSMYKDDRLLNRILGKREQATVLIGRRMMRVDKTITSALAQLMYDELPNLGPLVVL